MGAREKNNIHGRVSPDKNDSNDYLVGGPLRTRKQAGHTVCLNLVPFGRCRAVVVGAVGIIEVLRRKPALRSLFITQIV